MICVSIQEKTVEACLGIMKDAELVELRLDLMLLSGKEIQELISSTHKEIIVTCREGSFSNTQRVELLKTAIVSGAKFVDVEIENSVEYKIEIIQLAKENNCKLIFSYHNFEATPTKIELQAIIDKSLAEGADLVKIACFANSIEDSARVLSLYENNRNLIAFCMGDLGRITRVASVFLGAPFIFVAPTKDSLTAPGQLANSSMEQIIGLLKNV